MTKSKIDVRKGMPSVALDRAEFSRRYRARFYDPIFDSLGTEIARLEEAAWDAYDKYRKTPRARPAGPGFADPGYEVAVEWLATREAIHEAEKRQKDPKSRSRILMVNASARSDQTCPGEISKTYRLATMAREAIVARAPEFEIDFLDLSALTAERGRVIYPCKACVSTAQPVCHWPCSCYPNHALGQAGDWMAELYPRWAAAHGVMIVTPVNWYQAPSVLKLMIDRLVCADGGNPDQTSTHGKDPARAKELELAGWPYPKHLAGRVFAVVVHGDAAGVENLRRILVDWLTDIGLIQAARQAVVGAYLGYYRPYATSYADLDEDTDLQAETVNAALAVVEAVRLNRAGELKRPDAALHDSREK